MTDDAFSLAREIGEFIAEKGHLMTRRERFALGLGRAQLFMVPGECRSRSDMARDAGVSRQAIEAIELRALRKCRRTGLRFLAEEHLTLR